VGRGARHWYPRPLDSCQLHQGKPRLFDLSDWTRSVSIVLGYAFLLSKNTLQGMIHNFGHCHNARPHYVVSEDQLTSIEQLSEILRAVAAEVVVKKKKKVK
jgi:hypothetical protein